MKDMGIKQGYIFDELAFVVTIEELQIRSEAFD
jgi:hypothetical protein